MVELNNVEVKYNKLVALNNVSLKMNSGNIFGLLGVNGAGKTTLIKAMLDLVKLNSGEIRVFNESNQNLSSETLINVGVVLDDLYLIEELNALEFLLFISKLYKLDKDIAKSRAVDLIELFYDNHIVSKTVTSFSTGMKKKLAFCAAVIHLPRLLILDEPFSGIDPVSAQKMITLLKGYARDDRLVLISSHDLTYVSKVASHICVLDKGSLLFDGTLSEFTSGGKRELNSSLLDMLQSSIDSSQIDWI